MSYIRIDHNENELEFNYPDVLDFSDDLLIDVHAAFAKLNPNKPITLEVNGFCPVAIYAYLMEVSNHCDLTIIINDDTEGLKWVEQLKAGTNGKAKIIGSKII